MNASKTRGERRKDPRPWWEQILRGERTGLLAGSIRGIARLGSMGYAAGLKGREIAYRRGLLASKKLPQPTICVGNITVGGTGKTPLVIRLTQDLLHKGLRPAVLLRGYKREQTSRRPVVVRDADRVLASVANAGDEAMELAVRLPGACVGVGADRYAVGSHLLERYPINCFVLDDGFQHHRLQRDINIVTLDVTDPWGGGELLPAGLLRESPESLRRADAVMLTRTGSIGPDRLTVLRAEVSTYIRPSSAILESRHEPQAFVALGGGRAVALEAIRGKACLAVSAIGNPHSFETALVHLGGKIAGALRLADHENRRDFVWDWIRKHRQRGQWVVMTEKDAMRWRDPAPSEDLARDVYAMRMDLTIASRADHWNQLLELVRQLAHAR